MERTTSAQSTRRRRPPRRARRSLRPPGRGWPGRVLRLLGALTIFTIPLVVSAAATAGFRPVIVAGDSMAAEIPRGSLVIAGPSASVEVGDLLVLRGADRPAVTHRVIELEHHRNRTFAITKGDGNDKPDAAPYALGSEELVARTVVPHLGSMVLLVTGPSIVAVSVGSGLVTISGWFFHHRFRRLSDHRGPTAGGGTEARPSGRPSRGTNAGPGRRRRWLVAAIIVAAGSMVGSAAGALYRDTGPVPGNTFSTPPCFDAQLGSVQRGQTLSSTNGVQSVTITAVDPAAAFVITSVRSNANEPADSMVQAHLANATTIELTRRTDGGPASVVVEWAVVEYSCGLSVQRGVVSGNNGTQLDVALTSVDTTAAFALLSSVGATTDTDFDGSAMAIAELTGPANLRLRTLAPATLPSSSSYAWQVVSFDDPTDVEVQAGTVNLGAGASGSLPITAVDPDTTLILASAATGSAGADIDERMVRTHLASSTSVSVDRNGGGDAVEVHVQVIELRDGSTVKHGTLDFGVGQASRTVTIDPVDPNRTTVLSTVQVPGSQSGGLTAMSADDVVGEGSAAFALTDEETVTVTRDAATATASFGWQAVQWGGPTWWDADYTFRQRIDVTSGSAAAPGGYSVPVVVDHAALVSAGMSRADADDLRVVRWDGSTWTELDRILDDGKAWNAVDSTFWFRTSDPVAAASTDSYWMYFGNGGTPPAPLQDPENVWLLTEDFESGTLGDFEDRTGGTAWYEAQPWTRRVPLTIAAGAVTADLTDFTVLVQVTSFDLGANAQADGDDIRFTAANGTTTLAHEIERWDPGTGSLTAWVRVPSLPTGSATTLYLYYGAADSPAQQDPRATWASEVIGAWHLGLDPSGPAPQVDDSTVANRDGISAGAMSSGDLVPGLVGRAVDFDGVDDRFDLGNWELSDHGELTASAWVNLDSVASTGAVLAKGSGPAARVVELGHNGSAARARLSVGGTTAEVSGGTLSTGAWHHLVASWDGTSLQLHVDGVRVAAAGAYGVIDADPAMPVTIGDFGAGGGPIDGRVDEVRLEATGRSSAWIAATEQNQRSPGTFVTRGVIETGSWLGQGTWLYRKPVVIDADQIDATLTDFPVLIQVTDAELAAAAQIGGEDIVFTAADGLTRLDHEIESWDRGTGALTAWVRVPTLDDTTDTDLFVYYGNATAVDQQDPGAVFGDEGDLVAHLS